MNLNVWEYHTEQMAMNPAYKEAYNALESEFAGARALIEARSNAETTQDAQKNRHDQIPPHITVSEYIHLSV